MGLAGPLKGPNVTNTERTGFEYFALLGTCRASPGMLSNQHPWLPKVVTC